MEQNHYFRGAWRCYPARRFQESRPYGDEAGRAWIFGEPAAEKIGVGLERPTYFITIHPALHGMVWDYRLGMDSETGADCMSCRFGERVYVRSAQYIKEEKLLMIRLRGEEEIAIHPPVPPDEKTADGFGFAAGETGGFFRCLTPCRWVGEALCCAGETVFTVALGPNARTQILNPARAPQAAQRPALRLGERPDDFSASNERMSLDAAQNQGLNALLCRFYLHHSRELGTDTPLIPRCECERLAEQAEGLAQGGQGESAHAVLVRLCRAHLNDGLYLESGDVRGLSGDMASETSRQLPGATLVMARTIQRMLIGQTGAQVSLAPALPRAWARGRLSNLALDRALELEYLEWSLPGRWIDVKIHALEPIVLCLRFPAPIPGEGGADGTDMELRLSADGRARRFVRLPTWGG